jgi:hypothetical protein
MEVLNRLDARGIACVFIAELILVLILSTSISSYIASRYAGFRFLKELAHLYFDALHMRQVNHSRGWGSAIERHTSR